MFKTGAILISILFFVTRLCFILPCINIQKGREQRGQSKLKNKKLMVLLGSGGHTGEMLRLIETVDASVLGPIEWVVSSGDTTSATRLRAFLDATPELSAGQKLIKLQRARQVGEGIKSSIISTLKSARQTVALLGFSEHRPDLLVLNGPGTAVPLCFVATILNFIGVSNTRIVYVESLARVKGLSLSGRLCYPLSHRFIVQWSSLKELYPRSEYYGILV